MSLLLRFLTSSMDLYRQYPHLRFKRHWKLSDEALIMLGQCDAFVRAINNTPILPGYYHELMAVALIKGAQATTAIEGNTLTDEEIRKLKEGQRLPPSKEYQEREVSNILDAFNKLLTETIYEKREQLITPELLLRFHKLAGKDLGEHFSAIPGRFREADVVVGNYRCPDYLDVPQLTEQDCRWLRQGFKYEDGQQSFGDVQ